MTPAGATVSGPQTRASGNSNFSGSSTPGGYLPQAHEGAHYALLSDFGSAGLKPRPIEKGFDSLSNAPNMQRVGKHLEISRNGHNHQVSLKPASAGLIGFDIDAGGHEMFELLRSLIRDEHIVAAYETDRARLDPQKAETKGNGYHIWIVAEPKALALANRFDKNGAMPKAVYEERVVGEFEIFARKRFLRIPDTNEFTRQLKGNHDSGQTNFSSMPAGEFNVQTGGPLSTKDSERVGWLEDRYSRKPISRTRLRNVLAKFGIEEPDKNAFTIGDEPCISESLLADLFLANDDFRASHRHNQSEGCWYRRGKDGIWDKDEDASRPNSVFDSIRRVTKLALDEDAQLNERTTAHAERLRQRFLSLGSFVSVMKILARYLGERHSFWDSNEYALGTASGVYDMRTGVLADEDLVEQANVSTRTAVTPNFQAEPTFWLGFLEHASRGDQAFVDAVQKLMGYALFGKPVEQKFAYVYGEPNTGKSTLTNMFRYCIGGYGKTAEAKDLMHSNFAKGHREVIARLAKARVVFVSEPGEGSRWDSGTINRLVDGGTLVGNFMRRDSFEFVSLATLWCDGNFLPRASGRRDGILRRKIVVPFDHVISEDQIDPDLGEKLRDEAPAILAWIIAGFQNWRDQGLRELPGKIVEATQEYKEDASRDVVTDFAEECLDLTRQEYDVVPTAKVYQFFISWMRAEQGVQEVRMTQRSFNDKLRSRLGLERPVKKIIDSNQHKCWIGVRILPDANGILRDLPGTPSKTHMHDVTTGGDEVQGRPSAFFDQDEAFEPDDGPVN